MNIKDYTSAIHLPQSDSHKGQNGKVMIIGGSELFHAASQWSLLVASRIVDMVFYSSIPSNNKLIQEAKQNFPNGIVVPQDKAEDYIEEADVTLIGPGMERTEDTAQLVDNLVQKYPHKKWVIDAGALQMINPQLFDHNMIITPHHGEFDQLLKKSNVLANVNKNLVTNMFHQLKKQTEQEQTVNKASLLSAELNSVTILLKGQIDLVVKDEQVEIIEGGNPGMTKGGTGDVLAGLVAGLYALTDDAFAAATVASYINKKAGDDLRETVGTFFNATDLANQIPQTMDEVFSIS